MIVEEKEKNEDSIILLMLYSFYLIDFLFKKISIALTHLFWDKFSILTQYYNSLSLRYWETSPNPASLTIDIKEQRAWSILLECREKRKKKKQLI